MRLARYGLALLAVGCGSGDGGQGPPSTPAPDSITVALAFRDPATGRPAYPGAELNVTIAGLSADDRAVPGATILVRVHKGVYHAGDTALIVPDTLPQSTWLWEPTILVHRIYPDVLHLRWQADLAGPGPDLALDVYAPGGLAGVRLDHVRWEGLECVYGVSNCYPIHLAGDFAVGPDPSLTGIRGWIKLPTDTSCVAPLGWCGWPTEDTPWVYAMFRFDIADQQGHHATGGCDAPIPAPPMEIFCDVNAEP